MRHLVHDPSEIVAVLSLRSRVFDKKGFNYYFTKRKYLQNILKPIYCQTSFVIIFFQKDLK